MKTAESAYPGQIVSGLLVALFLFGAALRVANIRGVNAIRGVYARSPDERVYTDRARVFLKSGLVRGTRTIVQSHIRGQQWAAPPPTRIGYVVLVAATMALTRVTDERAGSYVSVAASILSLLVAIWIGLRFFGGWVTVSALLLLTVFTADLVLARRCWQDSLVGLAGIIMFVLTLESSAAQRGWFIPLLIAVGSVSLLVKETLILVYGPCLLVVLWTTAVRDRSLAKAATLAGTAVLGALVSFAILVQCTGALGTPLRIVWVTARHHAVHPYTLQSSTGPGYLLLIAFEALSPLTVTLAILGFLITVLPVFVPSLAEIRPMLRKSREPIVLALLAFGFASVFALVPHWLNLRFVSAVYVPVCLFAGVALRQLFLIVRQRLRPGPFQALALIGLAAIGFSLRSDYERFRRGFIVREEMSDLSVGLVLAATRNVSFR